MTRNSDLRTKVLSLSGANFVYNSVSTMWLACLTRRTAILELVMHTTNSTVHSDAEGAPS